MLVGVAGRWLSPSLLFFFENFLDFFVGKKKGIGRVSFCWGSAARTLGKWAAYWLDRPPVAFFLSFLFYRQSNCPPHLLLAFSISLCLARQPISLLQTDDDRSKSLSTLASCDDWFDPTCSRNGWFFFQFFFFSFRLLAAGGRQLISITGCCGQECASLQVLVLAE